MDGTVPSLSIFNTFECIYYLEHFFLKFSVNSINIIFNIASYWFPEFC